MMAIFLIVIALSQPPYWQPAPELAAEVRQVVRVDSPCGMPIRGCWNRTEQTIEIATGMTPEDDACVERHERRHAAGWMHDARPNYRLDCG